MEGVNGHLLRLNPADPVGKNEQAAHELFRHSSVYASAGGFTTIDVINAAAMLLINGLRQDPSCTNRDVALAKFDEIASRTKGLLAECYDAAGRKKGVFPFDQNISVPLHVEGHRTGKDGFFSG